MEAAAAAALGAGAALLLGLYALVYYTFVAATRCRNAVSLRGKTVLITDGNSGIGKATAVDLARRGARVILGCCNKARGESAVYDIRQESGNSEVILMILDLASLNSVRAFAQTFLASEPRLDILINNA
ncbi:dehydrogenase/reductase SDR family member 13-like, partial [Pseudonaja textilis]|uniref:dehydrogenase/reductase SDR family member 13-like n=1 Tax=Pseudonaja textilis TaxID=8673 RepID=UPI000EA96EEE